MNHRDVWGMLRRLLSQRAMVEYMRHSPIPEIDTEKLDALIVATDVMIRTHVDFLYEETMYDLTPPPPRNPLRRLKRKRRNKIVVQPAERRRTRFRVERDGSITQIPFEDGE